MKVYFAGFEEASAAHAARIAGVRYGLYSARPFVRGGSALPLHLQRGHGFSSLIQDSGAFSFIYAKGGRPEFRTAEFVRSWYDALVAFTLENVSSSTVVVEVDCQSLTGCSQAWELRRRMRADLPRHRIMNVVHPEDGNRGLDELIEFSDYLGIPPHRMPMTRRLANIARLVAYIRARKPGLDVHILGCTTPAVLRRARRCASADSTSWLGPAKFNVGPIERGEFPSWRINVAKVRTAFPDPYWTEMEAAGRSLTRFAALVSGAAISKAAYTLAAGSQA